MRDITAQWFKPDHQPNSAEPVEFQIQPLNLGTAYDVAVTLHPNGAVSSEMVRTIFLRNVQDWRGITEPCTPAAKLKVLASDDAIFGFAFRDWLIWTGHVARHAYTQSILTDEEKKTS